MKHTDGPWEQREAAIYGPITPKGRLSVLAIVQWPQQVSRDVALANAKLIASAPDLLEALTNVLEDMRQKTGGTHETLNRIP